MVPKQTEVQQCNRFYVKLVTKAFQDILFLWNEFKKIKMCNEHDKRYAHNIENKGIYEENGFCDY